MACQLRGHRIKTLEGSFSAVSKPTFASKKIHFAALSRSKRLANFCTAPNETCLVNFIFFQNCLIFSKKRRYFAFLKLFFSFNFDDFLGISHTFWRKLNWNIKNLRSVSVTLWLHLQKFAQFRIEFPESCLKIAPKKHLVQKCILKLRCGVPTVYTPLVFGLLFWEA